MRMQDTESKTRMGLKPSTAPAGEPASATEESEATANSASRRRIAAAAWLALLALALTAATFAWFSSSRHTNVTPVAHTVSESGSDLLIGTSESGPFDTTCTLEASDKTLYPVSSADLSTFWRATFQNASGITTDYAECTSAIGDYALMGSVYLQGGTQPLSVYLYESGMSISSDVQMLASLRLGLIFEGSSGAQTYIFACDDLGNTAGAAYVRTTAQDNVVVSGSSSWSYVADPALSMDAYTMEGSESSPTVASGAQPLYTLAAGEVVRVRYFVYMEGCDGNCITQAQSKDVVLQLAFAAAQV